ncbi:MAG TPA: hypothetical protein VE622_03165 [Nitrososphaeraceae archaeon]|nr:hypothetical protein [Nitrososphaeraceae archaeon]
MITQAYKAVKKLPIIMETLVDKKRGDDFDNLEVVLDLLDNNKEKERTKNNRCCYC